MTTAASSSLKRNQSVGRATSLLRAVAARPRGATAAELARATGLTPATAGRFLATLVDLGFLSRRPDDLYVLGLELVRIARAADPGAVLAEAARPLLDGLAARARETVTLSLVRDGERDLDLVAQLDPPELVVRPDWLGRRFPLHASAAGKLLLASLAPPQLDAVLAEPLARLTSHTITEASALRRELEAVRGRGYAELVDELEDGLAALAAPVRDERGALLAALALSGPTGRFDAKARAAAVDPLLATASALEALWARN